MRNIVRNNNEDFLNTPCRSKRIYSQTTKCQWQGGTKAVALTYEQIYCNIKEYSLNQRACQSEKGQRFNPAFIFFVASREIAKSAKRVKVIVMTPRSPQSARFLSAFQPLATAFSTSSPFPLGNLNAP